ncbi:unnamed protein product [[Candida] boidinii]|nr:unnamed protein product [[Candida] boidinii]
MENKQLTQEIETIKLNDNLLDDEVKELQKDLNEKSNELQDKIEEINKLISANNEKDEDYLNLKKINSDLKIEIKNLQNTNEVLKSQEDKIDKDKDLTIIELQKQLNEAKDKILKNEEETEQNLQNLAQDLYLQYSAKHEQKVLILKKGYETKWSNKLKKLNKENESLKEELESSKKKIQLEINAKNKLVELWDELVSVEGSKIKPLPSYIRK